MTEFSESTYPPHPLPELHLMNMNELNPGVISIVLCVCSLAAICCSAFPHFISLTYPHAPRFGPPVPPGRGAEINFVSHLHIEKGSPGSFSGLTHSNTGVQYTYALLRHVPSRRPFLSFPTQTHTVFHFTRLGCRTLSIRERVSWRSDERSCLMSQLSEDRPGTPARESEIQPLR